MNRTTNGFDTTSLAQFTTDLLRITGKMDGNSNFPNQQADVAILLTDSVEFITLAQTASGGDKEAILTRDAKRKEIVVKLRHLGNDVTAVAKGDEAILESSGFPTLKPRQPSAPMVKPDTPKVYPGVNTGQIGCDGRKQSPNEKVSFMITPTPEDENSWKMYPSSENSFLFTGLTKGQLYNIRYSLSGVRNQFAISDSVSYISQ